MEQEKRNKKVLIITYYWPPAGGPGVQRWLKFTKYLPEFGYEPVILTVDPKQAEYPLRDTSLEKEIREGQLVYYSDDSGFYKLYKKFTGSPSAPYSGFVNETTPNLKQKIARFIRGNFFLPDARTGWNKYAYPMALRIIREHSIDMVITTGPPMSTHLVGLKLQQKHRLFWVADFRDPWTDIYYYNKMYPTLLARKIDSGYERDVLIKADRVVTVSDYIRHQLLGKSTSIPPEKISVIPNGFDPADFQEHIAKEPVFTISYTGTLASDYTPDGFMGAITKLAGEYPFRLNFTGKTDPAIYSRISEKLGDRVTQQSFVPHAEVTRIMQSASLLLLIIPNMPGNEGNLTGKLFEYLGSGTPILCLGPPHGEAAKIIRECQAGETFDYYDEAGILTFLKNQIQLFPDSGCSGRLESVQRYSRKSLTRLLAQILPNHED